jgi:hypothetical protein
MLRQVSALLAVAVSDSLFAVAVASGVGYIRLTIGVARWALATTSRRLEQLVGPRYDVSD